VGDAMRLSRKSVGIIVITLVSAIFFSSFINVNVLADGGWNGGTTVPVEDNTDNDTENTTIIPPEISPQQYFIAGVVIIMFIVLALAVSVLRRS
jgi:hypothetical protein